MNHLSLFSGAGGSEWAALLLGWKTVGYVEYDTYCQKVIAARIADGIFPIAPIFSDIRLFLHSGYADAYSELVDVVSAGFPCQPFSLAGKRGGADDARNMWPETREVIRRVRPRFCLLENVPGLLAHGYTRRIFGDLAELGFDAEWMCLSAAQVGAPHLRKRLWIVATNTYRTDGGLQPLPGERERKTDAVAPSATQPLADAAGGGLRRGREESETVSSHGGASIGGADVAHAAGIGEREPTDEADAEPTSGRAREEPRGGGWRCIEPKLGGAPDGVAGWLDLAWADGWEDGVPRVRGGVRHRADRLKALGNGWVPQCAVRAWQTLTGEA